MFWAIALISVSTPMPNVTYVGQFDSVELCQKSATAFREQTSMFKSICVQFQKPEPPVKKQS